MAMPRPRPPRSPQQQPALSARAEKGKRLLKKGAAAFKAQWTGIDPETGQLGEVAFHNLKSMWNGEPRSKRRTLGIVNEIKGLGTLPSDLAPLIPALLRKLNPISSTADDDEIRPPSVEQLAKGTPLANAYSEMEPEGDVGFLDNLVNFAPPQWAEEGAEQAGLGRQLAEEDMGLTPNEDLADSLASEGGTMLAQLPVPAAWLRKLRGIRAAAEAKGASGAVRSALGAPIEYLSPTIDPSLQNYAAGTAFGAISDYLGAGSEEPPPEQEPQRFGAGGLAASVLNNNIRVLQNRAAIAGQPVPTYEELNKQFKAGTIQGFQRLKEANAELNKQIDAGQDLQLFPDFNVQQSSGGGGGTFRGTPITLPPLETTPRTQTTPTPGSNPGPMPDDGSISFGNDVILPDTIVDVGTGQVTRVGQGQNQQQMPFNNNQYNQPLQPGRVPVQAPVVQSPTTGAGIYGPRPGSMAPPQRVNNPSDPQWWLTYGFGPEQNFYSDNGLPSSGIPGGG